MIYKNFLGNEVSMLGFGLMRLPVKENKEIDFEHTKDMVSYAIKHGVNYFDTAYPYHDGKSELVIGEILKDYPRESFFLADKYPGHQPASKYTPKETFEEQLKKCQVDYFDYYLMHNINESDLEVYENKDYGIIPYFIEQKKLGKIKHLGFSTHAKLDTVKYLIEKYKDVFEFCQIQFNFLDYSLQNAKAVYECLEEHNIPVIAMEPLRGGKFYKESQDAFRWIERFDNIKVVLSGMSHIDHMMENVATFHAFKPLSDLDTVGLYQLADTMKNMVPCTSCHYCDGCPKGIDIPLMMGLCSEARFDKQVSITIRLEGIEKGSLPEDCISCNSCIKKCPQNINIPEVLKELNSYWQSMRRWKDICKEREEAANRLREKND